MTQLDTIGTSRTFQSAYDDFKKDLSELRLKKNQLIQEIKAMEEKEYQIIKAIDGIAPFIAFNAKGNQIESKFAPNPTGVQFGIKWKAPALEILSKSAGKKYGTSQLFDMIHPDSKSLNADSRRRAMVNLSIALRELVMSGKIKSNKKAKGTGKGHEYFVER